MWTIFYLLTLHVSGTLHYVNEPFQLTTIYLHEPLLIPKALDKKFLLYVDTGMVELWPVIVHLCEAENISLAEATEKIAELNPLHLVRSEWYQYKMRSLMRAHFLGNETMMNPVVIVANDGTSKRFSVYESRICGETLVRIAQLI